MSVGLEEETSTGFTPEGSELDRSSLQASEETPQRTNPMNYQVGQPKQPSGSSGKIKTILKRNRSKLIALVLFGGGGMGLLVGGLPVMQLGQLKSLSNIISQDQSTFNTARSNSRFINKIFGGPNQAVNCSNLTYRCRISTMSADEVKILKDNGYQLIGTDGKELTPDSSGRFKKAAAIQEISNPSNKLDASGLRRAINTDAKLNGAFSKIYPSRIGMMRSAITNRILGKKGVSRNPIITEGDADTSTKEGRAKNAAKNMSDAQARPDILNEADYDLKSSINKEVELEKAAIIDGASKSGPNNIIDISNLPEREVPMSSKAVDGLKGLGQGIVIEGVNFMCTNYIRAQLIVNSARLIGLSAGIAYAVHIMGTVEKAMSGDYASQAVMSNDISFIMDTFNKTDSLGNTAWESAGYQATAERKVSPVAITSSITGGTLLSLIVSSLRFVNAANNILPGGSIKGMCSALVSPFGQTITFVAGTVTQIFGALVSGGSSIAVTAGATTGKVAIKTAVKESMESIVKKLTKDNLKTAAKSIGKQLLIMGGFTAVSFFIDSFIVPYVAKMAAGTIISPDINGVASMDTMLMGLGALAVTAGLAHGMSTMTKKQYLAYADYVDQQEKEYAAMQRSIANPFDLSNEYSLAGSIGIKIAPTISSMNFLANSSNLLNFPSSIARAIVSPQTASTAFASSIEERTALLNTCTDEDLVDDRDLALDVFCNAVVGFPDVEMMNNASPEDVLDYLVSNGNLDSDGGIVQNSELDKFKKTCVDDVDNKSLSTMVDKGNQIPDECTDATKNNSELRKYFRLYIADKAIDEGIPANSGGGSSGDASSSTPTDLASDSRVKYLGEETTIGGKNLKLYALNNLSDTQDGYNYAGSEGKAVVDGSVAKQFANLIDAAQKDGVNLHANDSLRTFDEQNYWWNHYNQDPWMAAQPTGLSNHEVGIAIDFNTGGSPISGATCANRATSSSAVYQWLRNNSYKYGIYQYAGEPWHFDTLTDSFRCRTP